ncbi:MAG: 50S ribosomal protein L21 [Candidatus Dojkabacteria bacterium]|jgi:large subunit ribosomal protein L21
MMADTKKTTTKPKKETTEKAAKFAVIKLAGSQLKVFEGKQYEVNKLSGEKGDKIEIKDVLLVSDGKDTKIGKPLVKDAKVELEITSQKKGEKIDGLIYKAKSRYRKRYGFRPEITRVLVKKIS